MQWAADPSLAAEKVATLLLPLFSRNYHRYLLFTTKDGWMEGCKGPNKIIKQTLLESRPLLQGMNVELNLKLKFIEPGSNNFAQPYTK